MKCEKKLSKLKQEIRGLEQEFAQTVYDGIISPFMKRYNVTIHYGMGGVWFEKENDECWSDRCYRSVNGLKEKICQACRGVDAFSNEKCESIWLIVSSVNPNKE